jgi:flavin reductase (DIM6/NTAB) family NADH-FMN oxidoreductase RutF
VRSNRRGKSVRVTAGSGGGGADEHTGIFEEIVSRLDHPMVVVTVSHCAERAGCLVGFSTQCSIDPLRYAVCVSKRNHTAEVAARANTMVVHFLRPGNEALARLFGEETGDEIAKFEKCAWHAGPDGTPVIAACDWFAGHVVQRIDAGDHTMYLLDVIHAGAAGYRDGQLGSQELRDLDAGHDP